MVGTGTAGAVLAARLSEDPATSVAAIEWGPSDRDEPRALYVRRWFEMLEGEFDLDYRSMPQRRGNSHLRQARARMPGGCSTHNTMIAFRPLPYDLEQWEAAGGASWGPADSDPEAPLAIDYRYLVAIQDDIARSQIALRGRSWSAFTPPHASVRPRFATEKPGTAATPSA